jgi:hypothetical protein
MNVIPYSPRKVDLLYPARDANFFSTGLPDTEAALCAEMARLAYCRIEPYFQFDQQKIRTILEPLGFACQFFESTGTPEGRGTHGFLAFHDDADPDRKLEVVALRGTDADDPTDLADDADFLQIEWPGGMVHRGFAEALNHILPDLRAALSQVQGRILFTGHSLGAAMATLLASVKHPDFLYTFGSPRVGDAQFVSTLNGIGNRRFVDCCDLVARLPPASLLFGKINYAHFGPPYYIDRDRGIRENCTDDDMEKDRLIAASEYVVENAWRSGNAAFRELSDHAPINYVTAVAAYASQPKLVSWRLAA